MRLKYKVLETKVKFRNTNRSYLTGILSNYFYYIYIQKNIIKNSNKN